MTATMGRMPNVEKTPRRTIRVEEALWLAAQDAAEAEGRTVSDVIRDALTRYVKRAGK